MRLHRIFTCLLAAGALIQGAPAPAAERPAPVALELLGSADDAEAAALAERVCALAREAESRIWLMAYTLSDEDLLSVLVGKAREDGFDLRILVDAEQHAAATKRYRGKPAGERLEELQTRGCLAPLVVKDGRQHVKLAIIDDRIVVAGSKNFSDLDGAQKDNDVVVMHDASGRVVAGCAAAFADLAADAGYPAPRRLKRRAAEPPEATEPAQALATLIAPGRGGQAAKRQLLGLIGSARVRVHVAHFILSDPDLARALAERAARGVDVRVVVDAVQHRNLEKRSDPSARAARATLEELAARGALRTSTGGGQLHHKLAIIDDVVVTGSANWSPSAFEENHELLVLLAPGPRRRGEAPAFLTRYLARHAALWEAGDPAR